MKQAEEGFQELARLSSRAWHLQPHSSQEYMCIACGLLAACPRTRTLRIPSSRDFYLVMLYLPRHDSRRQSPGFAIVDCEWGLINDGTVQGHGISNAYPAIQGVTYSGSDNPASHSQTLHLGSSIASADGKTGFSISDRMPRRT